MFRSSLALGGLFLALAVGLGGCAADGIPGPAGEKGADGRDGVDGKDGAMGANGADGANGTNGTNGMNGTDGVDGANMPGAKTVTAFESGGMVIGASAATALTATISAPGKGKIIAISTMDAFCYVGQCATGVQTKGTYWMSLSPDAANDVGVSHGYFWLAPEETENTSRTVVFDVAAAGDFTVHLRANASSGTYGVYRRSLTLLFVPES